jgi:hypothetical protein
MIFNYLRNIIYRIYNKSSRVFKKNYYSIYFKFFSSYNHSAEVYHNSSIFNKLESVQSNVPLDIINKICNHEFDLLGSGFVKIYYGMVCKGVNNYLYTSDIKVNTSNNHFINEIINKSNRSYSKYLYDLIDKNYQLIDWQIDFKSGYRWNSNVLSKRIIFGNILGVDIKVPWELSRLQHLPQLALFISDKNECYNYILSEIKNQLLDFIAFNPPNFGVNWVCNMDVAIRAANIVTTMGILDNSEINFEPKIRNIINKSLYDHGLFIRSNLEWNNGQRGNHYLSNVCGLTFISFYLKNIPELISWKNYCIKSIKNEILFQFQEDGSNFENSTCYHKLTYEMLLYTISLIYRNQVKLNIVYSKAIFERIYKMYIFLKSVKKNNDNILQIGDNDSGCFLKLYPIYDYDKIDNIYYENNLSLKYILNFSNKLLDNIDSIDTKKMPYNLFYTNFEFKYTSNESINSFFTSNHIIDSYKNILDSNKSIYRKEYSYNLNITDDIEIFNYENFGLTIYKNSNFYLSIRNLTKINPSSPMGHIHEDQLSIELTIDDKDIFQDPGSFLYTPIPEYRNLYRSSNVHFSPFYSNFKFTNTFCKIPEPKVTFKFFNENTYISECTYNNQNTAIYIKINNNKIDIKHYIISNYNTDYFQIVPYSNNYGTVNKY